MSSLNLYIYFYCKTLERCELQQRLNEGHTERHFQEKHGNHSKELKLSKFPKKDRRDNDGRYPDNLILKPYNNNINGMC